jgi:hypothetical protein
MSLGISRGGMQSKPPPPPLLLLPALTGNGNERLEKIEACGNRRGEEI